MESFEAKIEAMLTEVRLFRKELSLYSPDKVYTKNLDDPTKSLYSKTPIKIYKQKAEKYLCQFTDRTHINTRIIIALIATEHIVTKQDISQHFPSESWKTISYHLYSLRKHGIIYVPK
jgi:hypothetical protein